MHSARIVHHVEGELDGDVHWIGLGGVRKVRRPREEVDLPQTPIPTHPDQFMHTARITKVGANAPH